MAITSASRMPRMPVRDPTIPSLPDVDQFRMVMQEMSERFKVRHTASA
jgi:hypothetical protein